jgi:hypothetical protein
MQPCQRAAQRLWAATFCGKAQGIPGWLHGFTPCGGVYEQRDICGADAAGRSPDGILLRLLPPESAIIRVPWHFQPTGGRRPCHWSTTLTSSFPSIFETEVHLAPLGEAPGAVNNRFTLPDITAAEIYEYSRISLCGICLSGKVV